MRTTPTERAKLRAELVALGPLTPGSHGETTLRLLDDFEAVEGEIARLRVKAGTLEAYNEALVADANRTVKEALNGRT